ncbi:hypothetical protein XELAEV_18004134mg [Xenopus laevis]|uniref:Uncharacterized protein n=1 Tax=Xenopus laevis TaxID=8355 RepID=A0A974BRU6_XENLA|nr:hypothetical protein XELAEV_18004134mg [Xenopus laevis]
MQIFSRASLSLEYLEQVSLCVSSLFPFSARRPQYIILQHRYSCNCLALIERPDVLLKQLYCHSEQYLLMPENNDFRKA